MNAERHVTAWPKATVQVDPAGLSTVRIAGVTSHVEGPDEQAQREAALAVVTRASNLLRRPVTTDLSDPTGEWTVTVHPDGHIETAGGASTPGRAAGPLLRRPRAWLLAAVGLAALACLVAFEAELALTLWERAVGTLVRIPELGSGL